jgi:two-component system LytT family response regulator
MYRAVVVDDERLARREIAILLRDRADVEIVGEAASVDEAEQAVRDLRPDVVFLDIQLDGESGFDLLERLDVPCAVVFTTAFDEYALRAFEVNAVDYLLKPIDPGRLREAIGRLGRREGAATHGRERLLRDDLVLARHSGRLRSFRVAEITVITAAGDYTRVSTTGGRHYLVKSTMKRWLQRLPRDAFARVHRSAIVNLDHVQELAEGQRGEYWLAVGDAADRVPASRRRIAGLKRRLG